MDSRQIMPSSTAQDGMWTLGRGCLSSTEPWAHYNSSSEMPPWGKVRPVNSSNSGGQLPYLSSSEM